MGLALIVDDDADAADMLAALCSAEGYHAATAHTLEEARRKMVLQPPDVVLLDLHLPAVSYTHLTLPTKRIV